MSTNKQEHGISLKSAKKTGQDKQNYSLIDREEIEGMKGIILISSTEGHFLTYGKHRISPVFEHKQEAYNYAKLENWEFLHTLVFSIVMTTHDFLNNTIETQ